MKKETLDFYKRLAAGIAGQFGNNCEVVIHDLKAKDLDHTIVAIENGHVSGRKVGDSPSQIVLESIGHPSEHSKDRIAYLTKTADGKILKSSTIYIRDESGAPIGVIAINYDISLMLSFSQQLQEMTGTELPQTDVEQITMNVGDLLDHLLTSGVRDVGKPVAMMNRDDKMRIVRYLEENGAFLISKSGPKVCEFLGISKYTLYSYLDEIRNK